MTRQLPFALLMALLPFTRISSQQADNLQHLWFPVRVKVFDQYPFLYPLTKNMAGVCDGRSHYFLIDRKGRRLLTDTFTHIAEIQHPSQTHFLVWKNDKLFLLNIQLQLTDIQPFENFTWFPVNQVFRFREGDFYGLMHTDGTVLRQPAYDYLQEINGQIITTQHLKYGALSRDGSELIPTVFDEIKVSGNGYFTVRQKDKTAVFAPDGRQLTNFEFDMAQIRPDGSFFARNARDNNASFTLFQKDGISTGESNWRRTSDSKYTYWLLPGRKYAEQYDFQGNCISKKFPADSVFDYAPAYYHYKQTYEKPQELPSPTFQNAAFQDKNTHKIYAPDGKLLFTSQTEITGGYGSFFRTNAGQFQNGLLDIRGKEILKPEYVTIDILPNGTIYAQSSTKKDGLYDLRGNLLIDTATYENLTPLHPGYLLAKDSVEWALADDGSIIIPQSVQQISRFSSGHFYLQRNDTVLIIDSFGKLILQSNISRCQKINQLLALKEQGKWALALPSGDRKTPFQFDTISNVREYYTCYSEAGIVSYHFDKQQFQYFGPGEVLHDMNDHWLKKAKIIQIADGKKGIYKAGGREMIPCMYDQIVLGYQAVFVARRGDSCTVFTNDFEKIGSFIADSVQEMTYYHNLIVFQKEGVQGIFNPWNGKQLLTENRRIQVFTDLVFASGNNTATVYSASNFEPVLPDEIDAMPPKVYGEIEFSGQYIVSKNGKYGMIDTTGQVVVPFHYDQIYSDFFTGILTMTSGQTTDLYIPHSHKIFKSEGCSLLEARPFAGYYVSNKTFTGFIDYHLDWIIPLKYNYLQLIDRVGFRVCSGSLFGALSLKGDTIVPFEYAQLSYNDTSKKWTGEKPEPCRITLAGGRRVMIPEADKVCGDFNHFTKVCKYAIHTYFSNGKAQAVTSTTYGLVSKVSGKIILPIEYEDIKILSGNSIYLTKSAEQDHKKYAGLMDSTGNWLITPDSLLLDYVPSGFIGCTPGKKYGLFDRNGVLLLPLVYDEIKSWDYYKYVIVRKGKNWAIATGDGTLITPFEFDFIGHAGQRTWINAVKNGKWGYIDKTGKEVVPFQYLYADEFNGNWGIVLTPEGYRLLNIDGTLHEAKPENRDDFFSQSITYRTDTLPDGITATQLIAENHITMFSARQIRVTNVWRGVLVYEDLSKNNGETPHFGMLDYAGKQLCPPVYDEIDLDYSNEGPGLHLCRKGKLWGYIDFDGREVIAPQFEHADRFWNGKARVTRNRQRLLIDITGNILK